MKRLPIVLLILVILFASCGSGGGSSSGDSDSTDDSGGGGSGSDAFTVIKTIPADEDTGIPVDYSPTIEFSSSVNTSTLTVQSEKGSCQSGFSLQISSDDFTTCEGGMLDTSDNPVINFLASHGLLPSNQVFKVMVSSAVEDTSGRSLNAEFRHATGFTTAESLCTAGDVIVDATADGSYCIEPEFVDNEDGTITDKTNGVLWTKCPIHLGTGLPMDGDCEDTWQTPVNWAHSLAGGLLNCENLEFADRTDWVLPDIARMKTLINMEAGSQPYTFTTFFPNTRLRFHTASNYDHERNWNVNFLTGTAELPTSMGDRRFIRCVTETRADTSPSLSGLNIRSVTASSVNIYNPMFSQIPSPYPSISAYIGDDGSISMVGSTVINYDASQDLDLNCQETWFTFDSLASGNYKVIVVAENVAGYDSTEISFSTTEVAMVLNDLQIVRYDDASITLSRPTFSRYGFPTDFIVEAFCGKSEDFSYPGSGKVATFGADEQSADVTDSGHTFTGLENNTEYTVFVRAHYSDDTPAFYDVKTITRQLGRYQVQPEFGVVYDPRTNLSWNACSKGQSWRSVERNCYGTPKEFSYCSEETNACNGGIDNGLLQPPFDWINGPMSDIYSECYSSDGWRVPTRSELESLHEVKSGAAVNIDHDAFPNTGASYWSSQSLSEREAYIVTFWDIGPTSQAFKSAERQIHLRCVKSGRYP